MCTKYLREISRKNNKKENLGKIKVDGFLEQRKLVKLQQKCDICAITWQWKYKKAKWKYSKFEGEKGDLCLGWSAVYR